MDHNPSLDYKEVVPVDVFSIKVLYASVGLFLFSFLCLAGSSTFAVGSMVCGQSAMLPLLLLGRLVFGAGNGSLTGKLFL